MHQMKELEGRMNQIYKLSSEWTNIKNQDELILANTFINSKSSVLTKPGEEKKIPHTKRIKF